MINEFKEKNELYKIFIELAQTPSPSLKEEKVREKILEFLKHPNIKTIVDTYGNVIASIDPTDQTKKSLLISAHMDVIGDDSLINVKISEDGKFFETDKQRTLGADDKVGVTMGILLAKKIANSNLPHGGLELVFTRDEEHGMSGIKNLDTTTLNSEYVFVLDSDKLGEVLVSGAGYTNAKLTVLTTFGGHSGIDIHEKKRLNAVNLISKIIAKIPQGVIKKDETGTITSINVGSIIGGGVNSAIEKLIEEKPKIKNFGKFIAENSMTNIINTQAYATFSIRSADKQEEEKLIKKINEIIAKFNDDFKGLACITFETSIHLLPFERSDDIFIETLAKKIAESCAINTKIGSFHAGAETHIYKNLKNKNGQSFKPYLIGLADIFNMHSSDEKVDIESMEKGFDFLEKMFKEINK